MIEVTTSLERSLKRHDISEAIKRHTISKTTGGHTGLRGIINEVKAREKERKQLTEKLLNEIITPDEQMFSIVKYLYEQLKPGHPELAAVGLTGSGASGGMALRRYGERIEGVDIDIFAVFEKPPTLYQPFAARQTTEEQQRYRMNMEADKLIKELVIKSDKLVKDLPKNFCICRAVNLKTQAAVDLSNKSIKEIVHLLKTSESDYIAACMAPLFLPTFPEEVGALSRKKLLEALRTLARTNKKRWGHLRMEFENRWDILNEISGKHFPTEAYSDFVERPNTMSPHKVALLNQQRRRIFLELFDTTALP